MQPYLLAEEPPKSGGEVLFALKHALDHVVFRFDKSIPPGNHWNEITKFEVMIGIAAAVILLLAFVIKKTDLVPKGLFRNALEGLMLFIRDEMLRPAMGGHHADKYLPFFCTVFLFILTMNLLGMVPLSPSINGTATSNLMVTGALASIVITVSILSGLLIHKGHFPHLFVPSGLPAALVPLLFVLELVGFVIKHGVLMVRLFANMIAGHLVIGAFLGLIFVFKNLLVAGFLSVPLALFVSLLELLVAFLQAYVFTLLSVLFVGAMVHPEH